MEKITKEFLIKHGISEGPTNWFIYTTKDYVIDITHCSIPLHGREWHVYVSIYSEDENFVYGDFLIQTVDQFYKVMEIYDIKFE